MPTFFCRDSIILDDNLFAAAGANVPMPTDGTVVLVAGSCKLLSLPTIFEASTVHSYIILADTLDTSGATGMRPPVIPAGTKLPLKSSSITLPGASVSIYANTITAALSVDVSGLPGTPGMAGKAGASEIPLAVPLLKTGGGGTGGEPPGGNGGAGGNGGQGGAGGNVVIRYASAAASAPTASSQGGPGGPGGVGGKGGIGNPPGKAGANGLPGASGKPGTTSVTQVAAGQVFTGLEADWLTTWSSYRTQVGEYLFRLFDAASQVQAQAEFTAALQLDPTNTTAQTLLTRLIQQETPSGISRHLDMSPDYGQLPVLGETQLVVQEFLILQNTATQAEIAAAALAQLQLSLQQLKDGLTESQDELTVANEGLLAASANSNMYQGQLSGLLGQLNGLENQSFSLGSALTTVGDVVNAIGSVVGLVGGIMALVVKQPAASTQQASAPTTIGNGFGQNSGAIVSIQFALAASDPAAGVQQVNAAGAQPQQSGQSPQQQQSNLGKNLQGVMSGATGIITNFTKVYNDITGASNAAAINQLLAQLTTVTQQAGVATLRAKQAKDAVVAAQQRVTDYTNEVNLASNMVTSWSQETNALNQAVNQMIPMVQALADKVADDVFISRRALEIYQLEDASSAHFDYGWLPPDTDSNLQADGSVQGTVLRAQQYLQKIGTLPTDVITWNDIYTALNVTGTAGFDIVHPDIEVTIDDAAALAGLKSGAGILFSVGIGPDPASAVNTAGIYELKVNSLSLELTGASQSSDARLWIQHSGHWIMQQPPAGSPPTPQQTEFMLFPHVETFNLQAGTASLTAQIPEQPQSGADPGPPFSFWGRGVLADWYLYTDSTISSLNLSGLTAVKLTFSCTGLVPQGAPAPGSMLVKPTSTAFKQPTSVAT
jgi:hypothetical protein